MNTYTYSYVYVYIYIYVYNMAASRWFFYPLSHGPCKHTSFPLGRLVPDKVPGILQLIGPSLVHWSRMPGGGVLDGWVQRPAQPEKFF
jgi:hypothetical protein